MDQKRRRERRENGYSRRRNSPRRSSFRGSSFRGQYKWYPKVDYRNNEFRTRFKPPLRPPSPVEPVEGSEEYMTRKIQQTSAIIMRKLLDPQEPVMSEPKSTNNDKQNAHNNINITKATSSQLDDKFNNKSLGKTKKANTVNLNAKQIHDKIMNHITNLNKGRQKNFINANSSTGLDSAIEDMQKRQRLEISRILRDMNSSSTAYENGDYTNSIVPDIGIKIEELPFDVIEELKQTLNLDLEYLNEVIADCPNLGSHNEPASFEYLEMNYHEQMRTRSEDVHVPIEPIEIKQEDIDSCFPNMKSGQGDQPIEMKFANVFDICGKESTELPQSNKEVIDLHHSISVKEEEEERIILPSPSTSLTNCSASTVVFPYPRKDVESQTVETSESYIANTHWLLSNHTLSSLESTIRQFIENDKDPECTHDNALEKLDLVDLCIKHLTTYRRCVTQSVVMSCKRDRSSQNKNGIGIDQSAHETTSTIFNFETLPSHIIREDTHTDKRRRVSNEALQQAIEIKSESEDCLEINPNLKFSSISERVIAIERVENELLLATEGGNIIFANLKDGSFLQQLDVTQCAITSLTIVRGMNDFIYMYVGSLEEVLRVYDLRKKQLLKASRIDDQIRCMDSMWDYVFMGCKYGSLIRYSCKKAKVESEEKNIGNEILVLKASQEGPRRVLLVGHRHAPIYVLDAMSGLHLRSFSSLAITPTVYSLILNKSYLYCGTAKDDILVFSFQEGRMLQKLVADNSKGISCMKIYNDFLFAGCYNGSIYVYNLGLDRLVTVLKGPGGGVLCMEVFYNQVIVGTLTGQFDCVKFPSELLLNT